MLNTPPDLVPETSSPSDVETESGAGWGIANCEKEDQELAELPCAVLQVAKLAVEVKKVEATRTVELERLRQDACTARVRISEENKTQRSACLAAVAKRVVEEHQQTEREKIAAQCSTRREEIAAEVRKAELEAQKPKDFKLYLLLLIAAFNRQRVKKVGLPVVKVAIFLTLLRGLWPSRCQDLWQGILRLWQHWNMGALAPLAVTANGRLALPLAPLPALAEDATGAEGADLNGLPVSKCLDPFEELEGHGLSEYSKALRETGYDPEVLRELREEEEVEEMLRAIKCRPEHRELLIRLLQRRNGFFGRKESGKRNGDELRWTSGLVMKIGEVKRCWPLAATLAWLEERASTEEGQEIGRARRARRCQALVLVKSMLSSADGEDLLKAWVILVLAAVHGPLVPGTVRSARAFCGRAFCGGATSDGVVLKTVETAGGAGDRGEAPMIAPYTRSLSEAARRGAWQHVGEVLSELQERELEPNVILFNAAINAFGKSKKWPSSLWLLGHMAQETCEVNTISRNGFLSACERAACWQRACMTLGSFAQPNLISFNTLLSSCCRSHWQKSLEVWGAMTGYQPDVFTCSGLVRACETGQGWQLALNLCNCEWAIPNVVIYSAAISACSSCSEWEQALLLFTQMKKAMRPNVISYSAVIDACEKGGQWQRSLALLGEMRGSSIPLDRVALGVAMRASERGLQWPLALHFLSESCESGGGGPAVRHRPDARCFASALESCGRSERWQEVMMLVKTMVEMRVSDFSIARYEHSSQAGSTLDCFKHSAFVLLLQLMTMESSRFTCIDTHGGPALYHLDPVALQRRGEPLGIQRAAPELRRSWDSTLHHYVRAATATSVEEEEEEEDHRVGAGEVQYLGSPLLALKWLRPQDKAIFFELSESACHQLRENVKSQRSELEVEIHQSNSYWHLAQLQDLKLRSDRSLVLMDPPYEPYETYMAWNLFLLQEFDRKWPRTSVLMWFPYLDQAQVDRLYRMLKSLDLDPVLCAEFGLQETESLETSGLIFLRPPRETEPRLREMLRPAVVASHVITVPPSLEQEVIPITGPMSHVPILALLDLGGWTMARSWRSCSAEEGSKASEADEATVRRCLQRRFPRSRSELPRLLNCLGLVREAVEVGVQAGVHAHHFLEEWNGTRLRLVDLWGEAGSETNLFYVDIANVHGATARRQHRLQCEERLERSLASGHAEVLNMESVHAASQIPDADLDFVYLDARHDFAGVVADIHAWWPKVREGGVFAGHDFVDGEFPEGDFFWISALQEVLPNQPVHVIREQNRYPSFFMLKSPNMTGLVPRPLDTMTHTLRLYAERSKYFELWVATGSGEKNEDFLRSCQDTCSSDCSLRVSNFTPSRTAVSTLRPFACGQGQETCASEVTLDVDVYRQVCLERCAVTCEQRKDLFHAKGNEILKHRRKEDEKGFLWLIRDRFDASVPGLKPRDVVQAALNGMDPQVVKPEETQKILDAYVSATWGEETSFGTLEAFDGVMISVPPQQASIQSPGGAGAKTGERESRLSGSNSPRKTSPPPARYCLGILWGYAIRGMVKRLALDRQLDTVPEEAMHGMAILSSVSQEDAFEVISSSEEEFENDFELDLVLLDQGEWKVPVPVGAFQYRAVAYGILLADAEAVDSMHGMEPSHQALVEREVLLERSPRSWVRTLVETRVLTELRPEQSRRVATSIQAPLRRVVGALKAFRSSFPPELLLRELPPRAPRQRRDYYSLLGIPRSATTREIRSGYQWAAAKWHPQKNPSTKVEAQSRFRDIAEAYDVLIDPLRRQRYDAYGEVGLKHPPLGSDFDPYQYVGDPFELFNSFFSSADPLSVAYEPELESLPVIPASEKEPVIELEIECSVDELKDGNTRCVVVERTRLGPGFVPYKEKKPVTLPIRPGWQAGMRIIFRGEGDHSDKAKTPGDLAVLIKQKASLLTEDLEAYSGQYGTHGAIQRLQFIASQTSKANLKIDALKLCLDLLKRTTNCKGYTEAHNCLKELLEGNDAALPIYDQVWVDATQKQNGILKELYEQDLSQARASQMKENIRGCYHQLTNLCLEQGDYAAAEKYLAKSREFCVEPQAVFATCMTIIRLRALQRQYSDIQNFTSKAHHTPFKDDSSQSKIFAAYGLYNMATGKYRDAATSFSQVKPQDLGTAFSDLLSPQDVALYGVLCALGSLDRAEVQQKLLDSQTFRECLDMAPQIRDLAVDFCNCRYAACLSSLGKLQEPLSLDVHLHGQVANLCEQIRNKGIVQYFAPFMSVSLHRMAEAFNTDVESIQREVAKLIGQRQLDAKIDSHRKILHASHADHRRATYQNALRVSGDFLDSTHALILRMNLLKHDFGVHLVRQKK
ncbi:unnamed protein product [Durusdinium trenchii]|uniref:Pentatricopeptide repeat-containing protein, chloroplastic n=1 Tax=Durusdinium trenchii TaxID=1381693 RepID=A0ABP0SL82_9DINO